MSDLLAGPSFPAPAVVICIATVERPVDEAWAVIGTFAGVGRFVSVNVELVSGVGGIGTVRKVGDAIVEMMVGQTKHSYTYAMTAGPMAQYGYHGCVALEAIDATTSNLVYTLAYDQTSMSVDQRTREFERISARFQGAVEAMKHAAETAN